MTAIRYNPLTYCDKLVQSGLNETTAKVIAQHEAETLHGINDGKVVFDKSLADIMVVVLDIKAQVSIMREEVRMLELKMTIKFGAIMLIGVGLLNFLQKHT